MGRTDELGAESRGQTFRFDPEKLVLITDPKHKLYQQTAVDAPPQWMIDSAFHYGIKVPITLSIIGCVVNGPGEALMTDLGVTGGGAGKHMVYHAGRTHHTIEGERMVDHIVELVEARAALLSAEAMKVAAE
ncbi:MAG TPA: flavodoxin-dependent (E)-4-hydroxy-3-methylbut-2-enyl-diphosphate synthase [Rhodocyclaceae bacterium]|nr:flavodoxin-dependent (E)-4-hydroxy-3-methylbut-2-enyl-diphosphate synthase [Rhodocyclaceae bacterium]